MLYRVERLIFRTSAAILLVGSDESDETIRQALRAGAHAYLTKSVTGRDLIDAVSSLDEHKLFFDGRVSQFLLRQYLKHDKPSAEHTPTSREREVLQLLADGKSNKEVAVMIGTSPKTVETHRARIMRKLKVKSLAELIWFAIRATLTEP